MLTADLLKEFDSLMLSQHQKTLRLREVQRHEQSPDLRDFSQLVDELGLDSVFIAVNEDEDQDELVGQILGGFKYELTRLIRRDNHAKVYSVEDWSHPDSPTALEARAYLFEGLTGKQKRYRQRNLKRLSKRKIFETEMLGHTVVVYTTKPEQLRRQTDDPTKPNARKPRAEFRESVMRSGDVRRIFKSLLLETDSEEEPDGEALDTGGQASRKGAKKSGPQREKARSKQQQRRLAKREEKRALLEITTGSDRATMAVPAKKPKGKPTPDDRSMSFLRGMFRLSQPDERSSESPGGAVNQDVGPLRRHLAITSGSHMKFGSETQLAAFVQMKQQEISEMMKHQAKLPKLLDTKTKELEAVSLRLVDLDSDSWDWVLLNDRRESLTSDCAALKACEELLPQVIAASRNARHLAKQRLAEVLSKLEAWEKSTDALDDQKSDGQIKSLEKLEQAAIPLSSIANRIRTTRKRDEIVAEQNRVKREENDALWLDYCELLEKPLRFGDWQDSVDEKVSDDSTDLESIDAGTFVELFT